jgi:hypothetical protein
MYDMIRTRIAMKQKKTHIKYYKSLTKNKHMHEVAQIIVDIYNLVKNSFDLHYMFLA